jgi:hypothetical protein
MRSLSASLLLLIASSADAFTINSNKLIQLSSSIRSSSASSTRHNVLISGYDQQIDLEGEEEDKKSTKQKPIRRQRRSKKIPLIAIVGRPNVGKIQII